MTGFGRTPRLRCLPLAPLRALDTRTVRAPRAVKPTLGFYKSAEWTTLMRALIAERGRVCQSCGAKGVRLYGDHIEELADGGAPLDPGNIALLCGACHNRKTARERERRGDVHHLLYPEGLAPSTVPLTIVCGPPAAGKTTWVRQRAQAEDLVIDLDEIRARLFGAAPQPLWQSGLAAALKARNRMLVELSRRDAPWPAAWFIVGEPAAAKRAWWERALGPRRVVVLETPDEVCLSRIAAAPERAAMRAAQSVAVARWWATYARRPGEERVALSRGPAG